MHGIKRVFVCGLATDYCVKATAFDAHAAGFTTVVIEDASAAVNVQPDDETKALEALRAAGSTQSTKANGTAHPAISSACGSARMRRRRTSP